MRAYESSFIEYHATFNAQTFSGGIAVTIKLNSAAQ